MGRAEFHGMLGIAVRHQPVDEARGEAVPAADPVPYLEPGVFLGRINFSVGPAEGGPVIAGSRMHGAETGAHHLEVREFFHSFLNHLPVALQRQRLPILLLPFDPEAQAVREVVLIAQHHIHIFGNFPVYLPGMGIAAVGRPEGRAVIQVVGNNSAIFLRGLDGLHHGFRGLGREPRIHPAGMEPANAQRTEEIVKIEVLRFRLGDGGIEAVRAALTTPDAEAPLREIEAVPAASSNAVGLHPADVAAVHAALQDEILHQMPHLIVGQCRQHRCPKAETLSEGTDHIVLTAPFPDTELPCRTDPVFTGIQSQHHLSQRYRIVSARLCRSQFQLHSRLLFIHVRESIPYLPKEVHIRKFVLSISYRRGYNDTDLAPEEKSKKCEAMQRCSTKA